MINWGAANNGGFQNALAMGMQMGAQARQAREKREERNALAAYAKDPSEQNFAGLADVRPDLAIQQRGQMQAQQQEARLNELTQRALSGDPGALDELASVNFDRWKSVSTEQRTAAAAESKQYANAALDVLSLPPEQRAGRLVGYAQSFQSNEIARIAQLPTDQQEAALRAAVAEGEMIDRLIRMERPDYMAIPEGGTLVDTNNPAAVAQFGGAMPSAAPSGQTMTFEQFQGIAQSLSPEAAARQVQRLVQGGVVFSVSTPEQARQLPSGTPIYLPDGSIGRVP